MQIVFVLLAFIFVILPVKADGIDLADGRYKGDVLVFKLTEAQKKTISKFRTCHKNRFKTMNEYTPYVFTLTPRQSKSLEMKKGFSPQYFNVYETYLGENDAGPHWNLVLRFSEDEIEIPLNLLLSNREAKEAVDMQGWKSSNPCFLKIKY